LNPNVIYRRRRRRPSRDYNPLTSLVLKVGDTGYSTRLITLYCRDQRSNSLL
jgi:hypothetical protein